ncbi:MAG: transglutaminase domain-containing protein [Sedimentisphaerales bacterium]|nr:transglutaminase domain-containing protein [Sedimentisphaerales bacterium]
MYSLKNRTLIWVLVILILVSGSYQTIAAPIESQTLYYGIEINAVLCGYSEIKISPLVEDGKDMILLKDKVFAMVSALGSKFNTQVNLTYHIDPATGKFSYHDSDIKQGPMHLASKVYISGNTARSVGIPGDRETTITLPPDVVLENALIFPHLIEDFVERKLSEKSYDILEVTENEIQKSTYTKVAAEKIELAGKSYDTIVFDKLNNKTGLKVKMWIDVENGYMLKAVAPNNRMSYLADPSVVNKIKMADVDDSLFAKVDVAIADIQAISYMKVKATVQPTGLWVTQESLNVPGQTFTGTIKDNLVEGVFEIKHKRYDGSDAPPFPPDFSRDESVKNYLQAEDFIQSDDPVLVQKAKELTRGSKDSWQAACRLSKWVSENITYAIPGGLTARKTYDMKAGECGAHSILLAAFCRAVGIPARVVWGCMYVPNYGGAFGQHGWSEIYMGKAGWITVDSTASEIDYVDSGHIRIGEFQSMVTALNPKKMEVLDFTAGSMKMGQKQTGTGKYADYVGNYTSPATKTVLKVFVQGGNLAVDIPGKVVLALNDADEQDRWYCKLSDQLFFVFREKYLGLGKVEELHLHQIIPLPKKSAPQSIDDNIPEKFRPYLGTYSLAALQADFKVFYKNGGLAVDDPLAKKIVKLQPPNEKGMWVDEFNKNSIFFDMDSKGNVKAMKIDSVDKFKR